MQNSFTKLNIIALINQTLKKRYFKSDTINMCEIKNGIWL